MKMTSAVQVEGLGKAYGSVVAVDDVSFEVREGEIFGIVGPNGAGKTTAIECLEQKLDPRGFIRIHRATLLNLTYVDEIHSWFAGGVVVRLKDEKRTELPVARDRVRALKRLLGF
jgi:ABC-type branched-subunit amino acid transport system ATPase component